MNKSEEEKQHFRVKSGGPHQKKKRSVPRPGKQGRKKNAQALDRKGEGHSTGTSMLMYRQKKKGEGKKRKKMEKKFSSSRGSRALGREKGPKKSEQ